MQFPTIVEVLDILPFVLYCLRVDLLGEEIGQVFNEVLSGVLLLIWPLLSIIETEYVLLFFSLFIFIFILDVYMIGLSFRFGCCLVQGKEVALK